jgi:predicted amidohydrolase YtcJ
LKGEEEKMTIYKKTCLMVAAILMGSSLAACGKTEGPAEKAGKAVDKAMEKTGQAMEKAADTVKEAATDAEKKVEQVAKDAEKAVTATKDK